MPNYPEPPVRGADKYHGAVAAGYDAKREDSDKWKVEQRIIEGMLQEYQEGTGGATLVLDCPCGTGRFLPVYQALGFQALCVDLSDDMLVEAERCFRSLWRNGSPPNQAAFVRGDVRDLAPVLAGWRSPDVSVMCRLTRWLSPEDCVTALCELIRVTTKRVIFTARVRNHPHARGYGLIQAALKQSADAGRHWRIARDEAGYQEDYRIIALEPIS
jgi:ubiquinone/menaquinone biosynthesis C-methylase UbiE